jgi:hypothetical protein
MTKRALITGITGQDGSYLAEFLLGKAAVPVVVGDDHPFLVPGLLVAGDHATRGEETFAHRAAACHFAQHIGVGHEAVLEVNDVLLRRAAQPGGDATAHFHTGVAAVDQEHGDAAALALLGIGHGLQHGEVAVIGVGHPHLRGDVWTSILQ